MEASMAMLMVMNAAAGQPYNFIYIHSVILSFYPISCLYVCWLVTHNQNMNIYF